eukprot:TRINITY_DN7306_c0_g1_i2.p1 TRINITY_DN7306_c0_g1~~TRINITY_DN7306_c0_g1_i2.p1  ORF type:complete len:350 (+),score=37.71 TRINITY_DN7306_c0_g1_i2:197-1246(+)
MASLNKIPFQLKAILLLWLPLLAIFGVLAYYNHTNGVPHSTLPPPIEGEWGPVTSNVDWCEQNYIFTTYIAEVLNSLSSFAFVLVGIFGIVTSVIKKLELRFAVCYFCITLVGLGSAIFHATLLRSTQAMDEVPMAFSMLSIAYIHESIEIDPKGRGRMLPAALFMTGLCMLGIYVAFPENAVPFQALFVGSIAFVIVGLVRRPHLFSEHDTPKKLLAFALGFFLLGCSSWLIERETCAHLMSFTLHWFTFFLLNMHAWWHVFISIGLYYFIVYNEFLRLRHLGRNPQMTVFILPFVTSETKPRDRMASPTGDHRLEDSVTLDAGDSVVAEERKRRSSQFEPIGREKSH